MMMMMKGEKDGVKGTDGQEVKIRRKNEEEDRERARGWEERTTLSMIFSLY